MRPSFSSETRYAYTAALGGEIDQIGVVSIADECVELDPVQFFKRNVYLILAVRYDDEVVPNPPELLGVRFDRIFNVGNRRQQTLVRGGARSREGRLR